MNVDAPSFVPKEATLPASPQNDHRKDDGDGKHKGKPHHRKHKGPKHGAPTNGHDHGAQDRLSATHSSRHTRAPKERYVDRRLASPRTIEDKFFNMGLEDKSRETDCPHPTDTNVTAQSSKGLLEKKGRINANHLLNFTFPARQTPQYSRTPRRNKASVYQPYNKERFVNANFRFIVNASNDYTANLADPDIVLDWDSIEQVLIIGAEMPDCPVCLCPPFAARVTKCGHIFCFICILRYLRIHEEKAKKWRKCPICWDAIYERDLKSVRNRKAFSVTTHDVQRLSGGTREGDTVELRLMLRECNSTVALPLSTTWPILDEVQEQYLKRDIALIPWVFTPDAMAFSRFMMAEPDYLETEYHREKMELIDALADAKGWGSTEEIPLIENSIKQLQDSIRESQSYLARQSDRMKQAAKLIYVAMEERVQSKAKENTQMSSSNDPLDADQCKEGHLKTSEEPHRALDRATGYYFFQAADGQHLYLHPLDTRILKHEYGDYSDFPRHLSVIVTDVEETTLTEDLRRRSKYMNHLPLACDVTFLEIDLKRIVSRETYTVFDDQLKARAKRRRERAKREEVAQKAADKKQLKARISATDEQRRIENDPFFKINHPGMTEEENEEMLAQAIALSASEAQKTQQGASSSGQRTVWGTPAIASHEEPGLVDWPDHVVLVDKRKHRQKKRK